jgi:hypothetical protein
MGWDGDEVYSGFPSTYINSVTATTPHTGIVKRTDSPNPDGRVQVASWELWGEEGNWIQASVFNGGSRNPNESHTGIWSPMQPGQTVEIVFENGNMQAPKVRPCRAILFSKGAVKSTADSSTTA